MIGKFAAACAIALLAGSASAQVPPELAAQIRAGGQAMDPGASYALYTPLFAGETYDDLVLTRDIPYGRDPLQTLDVYEPVSTEAPLTVLVFIHGGGFARGDKHGAYYPDNITAWAARNAGMVGVNINYRLAPGTAFPGATKDLAAALAWVRANIANHGGDPKRIVLFGHSAGANHVIDYLSHKELQGREARGVRGAVLLSPNYVFGDGPEPHVYYGGEAETAPVIAARLRRSNVPLFVGYAQFDPDPMRSTVEDLLAGLCERTKTCPTSIELPDHNHYTEGNGVGTDDQSLTGPLLDWINGLK